MHPSRLYFGGSFLRQKKSLTPFGIKLCKNPAACYSPTSEPGSTLADEALHFRVRNGNGCYILSMATGKAIECFWSEKRTSTCGCFASLYEVITASL